MECILRDSIPSPISICDFNLALDELLLTIFPNFSPNIFSGSRLSTFDSEVILFLRSNFPGIVLFIFSVVSAVSFLGRRASSLG